MKDQKATSRAIAYIVLILVWIAAGIASAVSKNSLVWQRIFSVYCVYKLITYGHGFAEETLPTTKGE